MTRGRPKTGRKYDKHISIQVLEEHNKDLKLITSRLNEINPFPEGKKWTIRDVILTLVYGFCRKGIDPKWFQTNHFEKLTQDDMNKIRSKFVRVVKPKTRKKSSRSQQKFPQPLESKVSFTINPEMEKFLEQVKELAEEDL